MSAAHTVDQEGRYDGLTLREAMPAVVSEIVGAVDPVEVIVFGSVARGDETADSDLDLLVVLDAVGPTERRAIMRQVRGAIRTFVPVDILIADVAEVESDRDQVGSAVYWPLHEGETVHLRAARHVR